MPDNHKHIHPEQGPGLKEIQTQLAEIFDKLSHKVPLYLFTKTESNDQFSQAAREVLKLISKTTPKISYEEYDLDHELAHKWNVDRSLTILLDPENFNIRWLGAPLGEEGKILVQSLIMIGNRSSGASEQSQKVLQKIDSSRNIKIFVSVTCPYCPQQAVNTLMAAVEKPEWISLEIIDIQANIDLAEKYAAFSTPQTFANDTLIAKGAQPEELFMASLEKMEQQSFFIPDINAEKIETDLVIVGGGPAGLTAGIYAARSGLDAVVLERGILGGQVALTPEIENYPGIPRIGGKTLVEILVTHALQYIQVFPGEEAVKIEADENFRVTTNRRRFLSKVILLATGANYRKLNIPGETELTGRGVSYCSTCDGPRFKGKKVIMVGGGNSAVTEALHLNNIGVDVTLAHRRDKLRAQEHLVKKLTADNIPVLWNTTIREIRGKENVKEVELSHTQTGKSTSRPIDGVFISIGYIPEVNLAQQLGIELTSDGYIQHDAQHRTNIPGIYSAGDVEGGYKQIVTAAAQGAEAAMSIFEDLMNPYWKRPNS